MFINNTKRKIYIWIRIQQNILLISKNLANVGRQFLILPSRGNSSVMGYQFGTCDQYSAPVHHPHPFVPLIMIDQPIILIKHLFIPHPLFGAKIKILIIYASVNPFLTTNMGPRNTDRIVHSEYLLVDLTGWVGKHFNGYDGKIN